MILVTGKGGQVGRALQQELQGQDALFWGRDDVDLSDLEALRSALEQAKPDAIINAAAYTAVDKAEEVEALANTINGDAVGVMADYAKVQGIAFIHYSTDYVYDGSGDQPRSEDTPTSPVNAYGRSKRKGEELVEAAGGDYLIFRTSWVYDADGKNFLNTMLRLGADREELGVVSDQIGAPSYAPHLAQATLQALDYAKQQPSFPSGIYHMCNTGETSWQGFAKAIFEGAANSGMSLAIKQVNAIETKDYPTPAKRPLNSRLDCSKLKRDLNVTLPHWQEGLNACLELKNGNQRRTA